MPSSDRQREIGRLIHELADAVVNYGGYADDIHESDVRSQLRDDLEAAIGRVVTAADPGCLVSAIEIEEVDRDEAHFRLVSGVHRAHALSEMFRQGATLLENHAWVGAKGPWAIHARGEHNIGYVPEATSEAVAVERFMNSHPRVVSLMQLREHEVTATRITL